MCKVLLSILLHNFEFSAPASGVEPSASQMGGVSRAAQDVILNYAAKHPV
jgi:hypothetical protein